MSTLLVFPRGKSVLLAPMKSTKNHTSSSLLIVVFHSSLFLQESFIAIFKGVSTHCLTFNYFNNFLWLFLMFRSRINDNRKLVYQSLPIFSKDQYYTYSLTDRIIMQLVAIHSPSRFKLFTVTLMHVIGSRSFRPDQHFKMTEIKQLCYFSTQSPFISTHF